MEFDQSSVLSDVSDKVLETAQNTNAILESLFECTERLKAIEKLPSTELDTGQMIAKVIGTLESILNSLDENEELLTELIDTRSIKDLVPNKIQQMGIARDIVQLDAQGLSNVEISTRLGVNVALVRRFIKCYNKAKPNQKVMITRPSIRDTEWHLEKLATQTYQILSSLSNVENADSKIKGIKQVQDLVESMDRIVNRREELRTLQAQYIESITKLKDTCLAIFYSVEDQAVQTILVTEFKRRIGQLDLSIGQQPKKLAGR